MPEEFPASRQALGQGSPQPAGPSVEPRLRVVGSGRVPVEAARVQAWVGEELLEDLGWSNALGEVPVEGRGGQRLVVDADGYLPAELVLPRELSPIQEVLLEPGEARALSGTVVTADGRPAGEGVRVLLLPFDADVPEGRLPKDWPHTTTDAMGGFTFEDLDGRLSYRLVAGGSGFLAREPTVASPLHPGLGDVRVVVDPLYGARIRLVQPGGAELRTSVRLYGSPGPTWRLGRNGHGRVRLPDPLVRLAGLPAEWCASRDRHEWLLLYRSLDGSPVIGPVHFEVQVPGYDRVNAQVDLVPVRDSVRETLVETAPLSREWGGLTLAFAGLSQELEAPSSTRPLGRVRALSSRGESLDFATRRFSPLGEDFDGVPGGDYVVRFDFPATGWTWPPAGEPGFPLRIGTQRAALVVDIGSLGTLRIDMREPDGSAFAGRLTVRVSKRPGTTAGRVVRTEFQGGPYLVPGLPAGEYEVTVVRASRGSGRPDASEALYLAAGEIRDLVLQSR